MLRGRLVAPLPGQPASPAHLRRAARVVATGVLGALAAACGGGGGGGAAPPPVGATLRLEVAAAEIGAGAASGELLVRLGDTGAPAASLLEVALVLPPQLALPAVERLRPAVPLATLDGDGIGNRFVVLCGDAENADAASLVPGPLFWLRLVPSAPRQPGTFTVRLEGLRAATRTGETIATEPAPLDVAVTVR